MSNRLKTEGSPYLQMHGDNPVDWYPWGEEAFAAAREQDKPMFLSIGYSACHWCHVIAEESFSNAEPAAVLNRFFIAVKVDREELPAVDAVYNAAAGMVNGLAAANAGNGGGSYTINLLLQNGQQIASWLLPDLRDAARNNPEVARA